MKKFLFLLTTGLFLLGGVFVSHAGAATPFDEVFETSHNFLTQKTRDRLSQTCLFCHTDGRVVKEISEAAGPEGPVEAPAPEAAENPAAPPRWNPKAPGGAFSRISAVWTLEERESAKPFGPSSACLGCHDGALASDVHREGREKGPDVSQEQPLEHPTAVPYPRRPNGVFTTERPTPGARRYWSIADRTTEGISLPTGPTSRYFQFPEGLDPQGAAVKTTMVRTSYGIVHCDSCHNPHMNRHTFFLRTTPRDLCFVCHDR